MNNQYLKGIYTSLVFFIATILIQIYLMSQALSVSDFWKVLLAIPTVTLLYYIFRFERDRIHHKDEEVSETAPCKTSSIEIKTNNNQKETVSGEDQLEHQLA